MKKDFDKKNYCKDYCIKKDISEKIKKSTSGITLIALVVTIIVILILAGVSIMTLTGENGLIQRAAKAKTETEDAAEYEKFRLAVQAAKIDGLGTVNTESLTTELRNEGIIGSEDTISSLPAAVTVNGTSYIVKKDGSIREGSDASGASTPRVSDAIKSSTTLYYVTWKDNGNGTFTEVDSETEPAGWYNYSEKKWANIKTVANGATAYWVWIPRYEYNASNITAGAGNEKKIDVKFIDKTQTTADTGYVIPDAFTFDGKNLDGIWVAKFEASSTDQAASAGGGNTPSLKVQVLPSVQSWRNITLANIFTVCRNMQSGGTIGTVADTVADTHMMKNTEWGVCALLSHSVYGKNGQVWNNPYADATNRSGPSDPYITKTGMASSSDNGADAWATNTNGTAAIPCDPYNEGNGPQASTTGTVYGVYDMAGGACEYVAGCLAGYETDKFGINVSKYINSYTNTTNSSSNYSGALPGDATKETAGWYNDYAYFVNSNNPVFHRGGYYKGGAVAGVFDFYYDSYGYAGDSNGFRPALVVF